MFNVISNCAQETEQIGKNIGQVLESGSIVCISGDLGTGKTVFVKGIAKGLGIEEHLTSPTFTLVNEYEGKHSLYHFDVYRVNDPDELYEIGFEEYIYSNAISVIEWAELILPILPEEKLWIEINKKENEEENFREIIIKCYGNKYEKMLEKLSFYRREQNECTCD